MCFDAELAHIRCKYSTVELFTEPGLNNFHREIWALCAFCRAASVREARMVRNDSREADFEVKLRDRARTIVRLQFTEADLPGRKRGQEYQKGARNLGGFTGDPEAMWLQRRGIIPKAIRSCICRKSKTPYPDNVGLLIYLNINTYGEWRSEIESKIASSTMHCMQHLGLAKRKAFRSIWVLWGDHLYRAWPNPSVGEYGRIFPCPSPRLGSWKERLGFTHIFDDLTQPIRFSAS